jgi:hypothetical protein
MASSTSMLFGQSGLDKIARLRQTLARDTHASEEALVRLRKVCDGRRKQLAQMKKGMRGPPSQETLRQWLQLEDGLKREQKRLQRAEKAHTDGLARYRQTLDQVETATRVEIECQKQQPDARPPPQTRQQLQAAYMSARQMGLFQKEMAVVARSTRNRCRRCQRPFLQLSEDQVACVCGNVEGNTEVPLVTASHDDTRTPVEKKVTFHEVLDLFRRDDAVPTIAESDLQAVVQRLVDLLQMDQWRSDVRITPAHAKRLVDAAGIEGMAKHLVVLSARLNRETLPDLTPDREFCAMRMYLTLRAMWKEARPAGTAAVGDKFPSDHMAFWFICHLFDWSQYLPFLTLPRTLKEKHAAMTTLVALLQDLDCPVPAAVEAQMLASLDVSSAS